jgi:hypothetical protein
VKNAAIAVVGAVVGYQLFRVLKLVLLDVIQTKGNIISIILFNYESLESNQFGGTLDLQRSYLFFFNF